MKTYTGRIIKTEWCKNWIVAQFKKLPPFANAYETNLFFDMAEKTRLWIRGTYDSPFSKALEELTTVEFVQDEHGNYCYSVFKLRLD